MATHKILISAPGTGTIADLYRSAQSSNSAYIYCDLDLYGDSAFGELTFLYDGTIDRELLTAESAVIVFDRIETLSPEHLHMLTDRIDSWTEENIDKPVTGYWIVSGLDPWKAKDLSNSLLPLAMHRGA